MTLLVLLLGAGMVSASEAGDNVEVIKDNNGLSAPVNYDVDKVVQPDYKSGANVEKTSTIDKYSQDLTENSFVNQTETNVNNQNTSTANQGAKIVYGSATDGKLINLADLTRLNLQESQDVTTNISVIDFNLNNPGNALENSIINQMTDTSKLTANDLTSDENMTPIFTEVEINDNPNNVITKTSQNNLKTADGDLPEKIRANVTEVFDDFDNKYNSRVTSGYYTYSFYRNNTSLYTPIYIYHTSNITTNKTALLDKYNANGVEYTRIRLVLPSSRPTGYLPSVATNSTRVYEETVDGVTYKVTEYNYVVTYKLQNITLSVYKNWNDSNDNDKLRPAEYTYNVYANDVLNGTYTLPKSTTTKTFNNVPVYNETTGEEIVYRVEEVNVPENYTVSYANYTISARNLRWNITNFHNVNRVFFNVSMVWDDNNDQDGLRGTSYQLVYIRNNNITSGQTSLRLQPSGDWFNSTNKTRLVSGVEANYNLYYAGKSRYNTTITNTTEILESGDVLVNYIITNKHIPETINFTVQKVWNDYGNKENLRPEQITINLLANGETIRSVVLNDENEWYYDFGEFDVCSAGKRISYTFSEDGVPEMYTSSISSSGGRYTITNSYYTEVNLTVNWDDNDNQGDTRPINLAFYLKANDEDYAMMYLSDLNNWKYTFKRLPIYNEEGNKIVYSVEQTNLPNFYVEELEVEGHNFNFTNKFISVISMNISKNWSDFDDFDGLRPDELEVQILANGEVYKTVTLNAQNNWTCEVTQLPKYINGTRVTYTVNETVPFGYVEEYDVISKEIKLEDKVEINFELYSLTSEVATYKVYVTNMTRDVVTEGNIVIKDSDGTVIMDSSLADGFVTFTKPTVDIELGRYTYNDSIGEYVFIPYTAKTIEKFNISVYYGGNNKYEANETKFTDEDVYTYYTLGSKTGNPFDMDGVWSYCLNYTEKDPMQNFIYLANQTPVAMPYYKYALTNETILNQKDGSNVVEYLKTLIYNHMYDTVNFTQSSHYLSYASLNNVFYIYLGENNFDQFGRIHYLDPQSWEDWWVSPKNRAVLAETNELVATGNSAPNHGIVKTTSEGIWVYQFYLLHRAIIGTNFFQDMLGIEYRFIPNEVEYTAKINNIHVPQKVNITVNKKWDDSDNKDGLRPENITLVLKSNGVELETILLGEFNNWTYSVKDLPKYAEGSLVNYTIEELNVPDGYNVSYSTMIRNDSYIDTFIHVELVSVEGNESTYKVYITNSSNEVIRGEIDIFDSTGERIAFGGLYDGYYNLVWPTNKTFNVKIIYAANGKYRESEKTFTQDDLEVSGEKEEISLTDLTFTAVNTHIPKVINFTISKIWNDTDNNDGLRPVNITVQLLANGEEYGEQIVLNQSNNWTNTFENLPEYINGKIVDYSIKEIVISDDYNVTYGTVDEDTQHKVEVNTILEIVDVDETESGIEGTFAIRVKDQFKQPVTQGNVVVYDNGGNVVVNTTVTNGTVIVTLPVDLSENGKYPESYPMLPELLYNYTIVYEENDKYLGSNSSFTLSDVITHLGGNQYEPPWKLTDGSWVYCMQPHKYGTPNDYTMNYVPVPFNTRFINRITGEDVTDYVLTFVYNHMNDLENFTEVEEGSGIANFQIQRAIEIMCGHWNMVPDFRHIDHSASCNPFTKSGHKLSYYISEAVDLVENGQAVQVRGIKNVTSEGVWMYEFSEYKPYIEFFGDKQWQHVFKLEYSFVPNMKYLKTNITNTHEIERTEINVTKQWNDTNNQDGIRPENVTIGVFNKDVLVDYVTLNDTWNHTFKDLPKYANGTLINYTVDEIKIINNTVTDENGSVAYEITGESFVPTGYNKTIIECCKDNTTYIVNTHKPEVTQINITKNWNDKSNQEGFRPKEIVVSLYANGVLNTTVRINGSATSNTWKYTFNNLDKYYDEGKEIVYTVNESSVYAYNTTITPVNGGFVINNTRIPESLNITVNKIWNDNDNQDGLRPAGNDADALNVKLYKNGKSYRSCRLSDSNNWTYVFRNIPKYEKGTLVNYTVVEEYQRYDFDTGRMYIYKVVPGYTAEIYSQGENFTIINTHVPELTNVSVEKVWNDSDDIDGLRPENIYIVLNANGEKCQDAVLSSENDWKCTFDNLPMYKDGAKIRYAVEEPEIPEGYQFGISINDYNITVTNTHVQENITINVTKNWNDTDDKDGLRPDNLTIQLLANGEVNQTVTIDSSVNWTYSFTNLTVYKDGQKVNYTINEIVPEGYNVTYGEIVPVKVDTNISLGLLNITRSDDVSGTARFVVIVKDQYNEYVSKGNIRVTDSEGNLIAEEELDNGVKYINVPVTFDAEKSPFGTNNTVPGMEFDVVVEYEENDLYSASSVTLTNITDKLVVAVVERNATSDEQAYPSAPWKFSDGIWVYCADPALPDYNDTDINDPDEWIGNHPVPYVKVEVNNETILDGYLPYEKYGVPFDEKSLEYYKVLLYYFGDELSENGYDHDQYPGLQEIMQILTGFWTRMEETYKLPNGNYIPKGWYWINGTLHGMPDLETSTGKPLSYYVNKTMELVDSGVTVPNHGIRNVTTDGRWEYQFNIYYPYQYYFGDSTYQRTFGLEYTFIAGQHDLVTNLTNTHIVKNITINVTKQWNDTDNQDGVRPDNITVTLYVNGKENQTVQINATNDWTYTFKDLPEYLDGTLVNYTIAEKEVNNYTTSIVVNASEATKVDNLNVTIVANNSNITLINTHETRKVSVNVTKVWDDNKDQDGIRPDVIYVQLYANNETKGNVVRLSESNDWTYVFENLDEYSKGTPINYTVDEVDIPQGYTRVVTNDSYSFIINNTHITELTNVSVAKVWNDANNTDGKRVPIKVNLMIGDEVIDSVELNDDNNWKHTFTGLDKYADGEEIIYNVSEATVPEGYTADIVFCEGVFKVINTHIPEVVNKTVYKVWDDSDNQDGMRPTQITIKLKSSDGKTYVAVMEGVGNKWNYTFTDLPKYADGTELVYTVEETIVPEGYVLVEGSDDPLTITNAHELLTKEINVTKVWNDNNNNDNVRPGEVTVELYADGVLNQSVTITGNDWTYTFTNLTVYKAGKVKEEIVYTIKEVPVTNYTSVVSNVGDNFTVTNTHNDSKINLTVNKTWDDNDDQDGIRPGSVTIKVLNGNEVVATAIVNGTGNTWTYTFTDLPEYSNGQEIVYTVEEVVPAGYTRSINGTQIVNTHVPDLTEINVTKVWDDNNDNDNARRNVTVELTADGEVVDTAVLSADNGWKATFSDLPVNKNGVPIVYNISEVEIDHYITSITENNGNYIITNTLVPELVNVTVNKVWNDSNNQDAIRPAEVTLKLKADGKEYMVKVVKGENGNWIYTFTDLPKFNAGKEIVYTVEEVNIAKGYTVTYSEDTLNITNTHIPEVTKVEVAKVWDDNDNQDGKRPGSVTVDLLADGQVVDTAVLNASNDWKHTFTDLAKYDAGREIVYTISESSVPEAYTVKVVFCEGVFKVINSHTPEVVNITVNKTWDDNDDQDGIRPESVTVKVLNGDVIVKTATVSGADWTYTFTDLPKYSNGQEIVYTIEEVVPAGYTSVVNGTVIVNTHVPDLTEINVTKVWDDNNDNDNARRNVTVELTADGEVVDTAVLSADNGWKATFSDLPVNKNGVPIVYNISEVEIDHYITSITENNGNYIITNTLVPELVNVTVNKVWNDSNNQDAIRPAEVTLKLKADGKEYMVKVVKGENGNWIYTFTDLPKFNAGKEIVYTVEEVNIAKGYTVTYSEDTLNITNTHIPEVTKVEVAKVWDDNDNQDGKRPGSVTVDLLADGQVVDTAVLNASNDWKHTFTDLAKYDAGREIVYTISESSVPEAYTVKVVFCEGVFKVINSHTPEVVNITVNKTWDDNDDQDGIRPESVTVKVLNGDVIVKTATVSGADWTYTFTDLPKYSNGQEIVYTIEEVVPAGYTSVVNGTVIVNTHVPELTNVSVVKVWDDNDNNDGKRPGSVTVDLLADGVKVNSTVLSAADDWKATFDNLPVNKDGKAIKYTIDESEVPTGYTVKVVFCEGVFKVINSHIPENTSISVSKVWEDANNQDAIRPNTIFVQILANGENYQLVKLSSDNNWKETINNLPKYSNGKEIVYTIVESEVPEGYTAVVDGLTIINTHIPEVTTVNVSKVWDDNNNNDGVRPAEVSVDLFADGVKVNSTVLSADNDWKATFDNLPVNKDGKAIKYTVSEASIENYTSEVVECCGNFKVINTHNDSTVEINITKVWVDDDNRDAIRPATVSVRVLADGQEYTIVVVKASDNWSVIVTDLPEYNNGNKVVYTVEEVEVPAGYTAVVDDTTITNTHEIVTKEVDVSKVWNDNNNNDGVRPDNVTVYLYANGKEFNFAVLSADNDWKATFVELPVYDDGEEIVYTVGEAEIANYTSVVVNCNGTFKVINTHNDSTVEINITKVWEDADNQDGIRPNNVTVEVLADGQQQSIIVIERSNDWKCTVANLPEYKDGKKVVYTVREINVAEGYTSIADGLTITNTHIPELTNVSVVKVWNDSDNNDGKRPASVTVELLANGKAVDTVVLDASNSWKYTFTGLAKYADGQEIVYTIGEEEVPADYTAKVVNCEGIFKVINTYIPENITIDVSKVWNDSDNQDGVRPDSVTVKVLDGNVVVQTAVISEADGWTYTFKNLPKYSNGQEIVYTVEEVVPAGYNVTYNGNEIINTHIPDVTEINVTKVWNDSDNNDAKRPDSVTVYLYADGNEVDSTVLSADNDWRATFKNLPVNKNGKAIVYTVNESKVDDYTSKIINCCGNYKIINTHINSTINLTINKVWNDSNDNDGLRPQSITIVLNADGKEYETVVIKAGDDWTYTFTNLPEFNKGIEVVYTVEEVEVPAGYNVTVDGTTIINTHEIITKNISVAKVWNDSDNNDGLRPDSVTVYLYADGVEIDSTVLSADNDWRATFKNLPVNKNGKAIVYTVNESKVDDYTSKIINCCGNYTIINTHENIIKNISVVKVWNDQNNNDGVRPEKVTVHLVVGDETVDTIILSADNDWKHTFENLPVYKDGVEIVYNISEDTVSEYETEITGSGDNFFVINTHNGIKINITGNKVWNDSNNNDGLRPENVSVRLLADGVEYGVVVVSGDDWTYKFENLPKYNKGHEIKYTVEEVEVPSGYSVTINGTTIINTYEIITKNISVSKVWNDSNNNDGIRPDSVKVQLLADGNEMGDPILLSSNNSWKHTFINLPVYNNGHKINYTVEEAPVDNYTCEVQGNDTNVVFINTHINDTVNLTLNKVWDDLNNSYNKRPENISINIYADGSYVKSVILSKETGWNIVVYNLTKFNNSKLIKYTVNESKVKYYNTTITSDDEYNFTITNNLKIVKRTCVWAWRLIGINETYYVEVTDDYNHTRIVPKAVVKNKVSTIGKTRGIGRYSPRHSYPNKYRKQSSWKPYQGKHSYKRMMSREKYRLFIFLCQKCFFGNMSYADFVAILKANGIDPVMSNAWNSSGFLTFDYDDLEKVPDSIELHDNGGHVQDSSDNVEKYKAPSSSGVIDEGKIKLEVVEIEE